MKELKKNTAIFWIAAAVAIAVLFAVMIAALVFTGRVNSQNKLALEKIYQEQSYHIPESNQVYISNPANESEEIFF